MLDIFASERVALVRVVLTRRAHRWGSGAEDMVAGFMRFAADLPPIELMAIPTSIHCAWCTTSRFNHQVVAC